MQIVSQMKHRGNGMWPKWSIVWIEHRDWPYLQPEQNPNENYVLFIIIKDESNMTSKGLIYIVQIASHATRYNFPQSRIIWFSSYKEEDRLHFSISSRVVCDVN